MPEKSEPIILEEPQPARKFVFVLASDKPTLQLLNANPDFRQLVFDKDMRRAGWVPANHIKEIEAANADLRSALAAANERAEKAEELVSKWRAGEMWSELASAQEKLAEAQKEIQRLQGEAEAKDWDRKGLREERDERDRRLWAVREICAERRKLPPVPAWLQKLEEALSAPAPNAKCDVCGVTLLNSIAIGRCDACRHELTGHVRSCNCLQCSAGPQPQAAATTVVAGVAIDYGQGPVKSFSFSSDGSGSADVVRSPPGNAASSGAEGREPAQTEPSSGISDEELGKIAEARWHQDAGENHREGWTGAAQAVRRAVEASVRASATRAQHVYQACLDWTADTGDCHFCNPGPDGKHDEECPMVEPLEPSK